MPQKAEIEKSPWTPVTPFFRDDSWRLVLPTNVLRVMTSKDWGMTNGEIVLMLTILAEVRPGSDMVTMSQKEMVRASGMCLPSVRSGLATMAKKGLRVSRRADPYAGECTVYDISGLLKSLAETAKTTL